MAIKLTMSSSEHQDERPTLAVCRFLRETESSKSYLISSICVVAIGAGPLTLTRAQTTPSASSIDCERHPFAYSVVLRNKPKLPDIESQRNLTICFA